MRGVRIASIGLIGFAFKRLGGLDAYLDALWTRVAFGARYGNQSVHCLLDLPSDDLELFNRALEQLIISENKPNE